MNTASNICISYSEMWHLRADTTQEGKVARPLQIPCLQIEPLGLGSLRNQLVTDAPCRFVLDETDGRAARTFNQASTLGAVLDMVTDRRGSASAEAACMHSGGLSRSILRRSSCEGGSFRPTVATTVKAFAQLDEACVIMSTAMTLRSLMQFDQRY